MLSPDFDSLLLLLCSCSSPAWLPAGAAPSDGMAFTMFLQSFYCMPQLFQLLLSESRSGETHLQCRASDAVLRGQLISSLGFQTAEMAAS